MKRSTNVIKASPVMGGAAFAHAVYATLLAQPSRQLAGGEDRTHPGEGSA